MGHVLEKGWCPTVSFIIIFRIFGRQSLLRDGFFPALPNPFVGPRCPTDVVQEALLPDSRRARRLGARSMAVVG
jgi:hypothetical protein